MPKILWSFWSMTHNKTTILKDFPNPLSIQTYDGCRAIEFFPTESCVFGIANPTNEFVMIFLWHTGLKASKSSQRAGIWANKFSLNLFNFNVGQKGIHFLWKKMSLRHEKSLSFQLKRKEIYLIRPLMNLGKRKKKQIGYLCLSALL